jgi:hypothetical protein
MQKVVKTDDPVVDVIVIPFDNQFQNVLSILTTHSQNTYQLSSTMFSATIKKSLLTKLESIARIELKTIKQTR